MRGISSLILYSTPRLVNLSPNLSRNLGVIVGSGYVREACEEDVNKLSKVPWLAFFLKKTGQSPDVPLSETQ